MNPLAPLAALILAGCATIYNPATGRQETVLTTPIETALGSLARAQMGLTSLKMGRVSPEELGRAQETGKRLAQVSDRKDVPYQFGVIQDDSINAFTLPGGTIYVHTKTLETADDDELAAVLGHEIGHVAARHVAKHLQADLGIALLLEAASRAGASGESARMVSSLYGLFSKGFSRQDELEADRLGIRYTQRAGFDPEGMIRFFEKMERERPEGALDRASVWNRTHPLTSERIARAKKEISELKSRMFCPECGREYASPKARFCEKDATPLKKKWGLP
ncbi:MAG: M48 family metalloprotease [Candidatus Omnitrophica bacterium]|nr:M48 family metalloprotease [Candidatus Omnitrophota bacterium]